MNSKTEFDWDWTQHAHDWPPDALWIRVFWYISKSVVLVRWGNGEVYLARPYETLNSEQQAQYDAYVESNWPAQIIPEGMGIAEILLESSSILAWPQSHVQSAVATFSQGVEFMDDLNTNFETLKRYYWLETDEDIKGLLTRFIIGQFRKNTDEALSWEILERIDEEVRENKFKTALFLYWLSWRDDAFTMDSQKRKLARSYFGTEICNDLDKHPSVKSLLQEREEGTMDEDFSVSVILKKVKNPQT